MKVYAEMPCVSKLGYCEMRCEITSQWASVPGMVLRTTLAVIKGVEGNALIVTDLRTPNVEPRPVLN